MSQRDTPGTSSPEAGRYEIRLTGRLNERWAAWFDGLTVSQQTDGTTVLSGPIADQAALYGVLQRVRDLGLVLVAMERLDTSEATRSRAAPVHDVDNSPTNERNG